MEKQVLQVRAFQSAFGVDMPEKPTVLGRKRAKLRQALLEEEVKEIRKSMFKRDKLDCLEGVSDGIIDAMYILLGTAHEYGVADRLPLMFDEVHNANMRKLGEDGKPIYRKDGKVLKPEGWTPPNLKTILNRRYHVFKGGHGEQDFQDTMKALADAELKQWNDKVEQELKASLKWYHRWMLSIANFLEKRIKKSVSIEHNNDNSYRKQVVINAYGKEKVVVDY